MIEYVFINVQVKKRLFMLYLLCLYFLFIVALSDTSQSIRTIITNLLALFFKSACKTSLFLHRKNPYVMSRRALMQGTALLLISPSFDSTSKPPWTVTIWTRRRHKKYPFVLKSKQQQQNNKNFGKKIWLKQKKCCFEVKHNVFVVVWSCFEVTWGCCSWVEGGE